jgi:hypothetical protein
MSRCEIHEHHEHHHGHHEHHDGHHECRCRHHHECRCGQGYQGGQGCESHSRYGCHGDCRCRDRGEGHHACEGKRHGFHRRFRSKAERIAELEGYLAELKAEAQAVEERLADLRR